MPRYCNDPKFSGRYAWVNTADPDQTAPIRVYTVCHSACIVWTHYSMAEPHCSNFRVIITNFWGVRIFRKFMVVPNILAKYKISRLLLASETEQTGLSLTWSQTLEDRVFSCRGSYITIYLLCIYNIIVKLTWTPMEVLWSRASGSFIYLYKGSQFGEIWDWFPVIFGHVREYPLSLLDSPLT